MGTRQRRKLVNGDTRNANTMKEKVGRRMQTWIPFISDSSVPVLNSFKISAFNLNKYDKQGNLRTMIFMFTEFFWGIVGLQLVVIRCYSWFCT